MNGIVSATSVDTGKVIDFEILTKYCRCKNKNAHDETCGKNFDGTSGAMEVNGALAIFQRSESQYNARYTKYLGDGDSKAFKTVKSKDVYGKDVAISKLECVGHIQKRMGTRLRRLKNEFKGKTLSDGRALGGKNRLTDAQIDLLQTYFGLAIRNNAGDLHKMKQAVWAIFFHKLSTNNNPQHGLCPKGNDTWCKFHKAQAKGEIHNHNNSLPVSVMEVIKPVFRDLSDLELLKKCLHGKTQNSNEALHNIIWRILPKNVFIEMETFSLGVNEAVLSFNEGSISKLEVLKDLGIAPGYYAYSSMLAIDKERLRNANKSEKQAEERARQCKRQSKRKLQDLESENADDPSYGAGMH